MFNPNQHNDTIQGLRGIAALLVVISHSILILHDRIGFDRIAATVAWGAGDLGVKVFFIISGFIMTATTYRSFASGDAPAAFMRKRIVRIVPMYWLATLLFCVRLATEGRPARLQEVAMSLFFIPYEQGQTNLYGPVFSPGWTLNYEMLFYILFALVLLLPRGAALALLVTELMLLALVGSMPSLQHCGSAPLCAVARYYTDPILLYFVAGILLALLRGWLAEHNRLLPISMRAATAITLVAAAAYLGIVGVTHAQYGSLLYRIPQITAGLVATTVCITAAASGPRGRLLAGLLVLGDASYSIYLTHTFVIGPASRIWVRFSSDGQVIFVGAMLVACSLVGVLLYRRVEKPMLRSLTPRRNFPENAIRSS
jgi:exopolysaccharide production protein ExoZ